MFLNVSIVFFSEILSNFNSVIYLNEHIPILVTIVGKFQILSTSGTLYIYTTEILYLVAHASNGYFTPVNSLGFQSYWGL